MARALLVALVLMLSFQSVWSMAASACAHEQTDGSAHFGHHEEHHAAHHDDQVANDAGDETALDYSNADHHHLPGASPLPHMTPLVAFVDDGAHGRAHREDPYPSASIDALERPPRLLADPFSARLG